MIRKSAAVILSILMCVLALTGCGAMSDQFEKALKTDYSDTFNTIKTGYEEADSLPAMIKVIRDWAKQNDIFYRDLGNSNIALGKEATDNYKTADSTTLHCTVSTSDKDSCAINAAILLTSLKDAVDHGKLTLLFTSEKNGVFTGARSLPSEYLKTDNFIDYDKWSQDSLFTGSAETKVYNISKSLNTTSPANTKAYRLDITGLNGEDTGDRNVRHPNPLTQLGDLIYDCRSSGIDLELSKLYGGQTAEISPQDAHAVVVVNEDSEEKFIKKVESNISSFNDDNLSSESNMQYTYKACSLPDTVISDSDTDKICSLMYTLIDGVFIGTKEDGKGDPISIATLGKLDTRGGRIKAQIQARSIDPKATAEMDRSYKETAELNDMKFKITDVTPLWKQEYVGSLGHSFMIAANQADIDLDPGMTFKKTACSIFRSRDKNLHLISVGTRLDNDYELTKATVLFLESLGDSGSDTIELPNSAN